MQFVTTTPERSKTKSDPSPALKPPTVYYLEKCPDPVLDWKGILSPSCDQSEKVNRNILNH